MRFKKEAFLAILLLIPVIVFAHGEEVLITFAIQVISIIIFLILLLVIKLTYLKKFILAVIYFLTVYLSFHFVNDIPFRENMSMINFTVAIVPLACASLAYLILKSSATKKTE
ncbi:MAG TPA: hypothetical protein VK668_01195 [Mucilaginibacter sp.]|nr:hypothetical protein [Mucilaginibacter sp.]